MQPNTLLRPTALAALMLFCLAVTVVADQEQSGCVTCHLDEKMIIKNLSKAVIKTSSMQTGSG